MNRFCANCGTEVDETAVFCPTCGQPIDQATETNLPPAPAWPDPATDPEPADAYREAAGGEWDATRAEDPAPAERSWERRDEPLPPAAPPRPDLFDDRTAPGARLDADTTRTARRVEPDAPGARGSASASQRAHPGVPASAPTPGSPPGPQRRSRPAIDLPITTPVTLSAWLIGGGSALAAIGAFISLFDSIGLVVDLIAFVALAFVALTVFFANSMPAFPQLRLATLVIVLVAFGVALDRLGIGAAGAGDLLLFIGTAAAVIGAILLELGRDQPVGGPRR